MTVHFTTHAPQTLLNKFDAAIHQTAIKGKIKTWEKNHQGYYTHKADEWRRKAYFQPSVENGRLTFYLLRPTGQTVSTVVYGYYHGHLIETFLNHFDLDFSGAAATALPTAGDNLAPKVA